VLPAPGEGTKSSLYWIFVSTSTFAGFQRHFLINLVLLTVKHIEMTIKEECKILQSNFCHLVNIFNGFIFLKFAQCMNASI